MAEQQAHALAEERYGGEDPSGYQYAQQYQGPSREYGFNDGGAPYGGPGCPTYGQWGPSAGGAYGGNYGGGYGGGGAAQDYYGGDQRRW